MNLKVKFKYNFVVLLNMSSIPLKKKKSPNKKKSLPLLLNVILFKPKKQ